jgi:hypothetical protein
MLPTFTNSSAFKYDLVQRLLLPDLPLEVAGLLEEVEVNVSSLF